MKFNFYLTLINELKMDVRLKPKTWNSKAARRKQRENHHDIILGNDILDKTLKAQAEKKKKRDRKAPNKIGSN